MLNVVMLNVIMLNVVMLNVVAPFFENFIFPFSTETFKEKIFFGISTIRIFGAVTLSIIASSITTPV